MGLDYCPHSGFTVTYATCDCVSESDADRKARLAREIAERQKELDRLNKPSASLYSSHPSDARRRYDYTVKNARDEAEAVRVAIEQRAKDITDVPIEWGCDTPGVTGIGGGAYRVTLTYRKPKSHAERVAEKFVRQSGNQHVHFETKHICETDDIHGSFSLGSAIENTGEMLRKAIASLVASERKDAAEKMRQMCVGAIGKTVVVVDHGSPFDVSRRTYENDRNAILKVKWSD